MTGRNGKDSGDNNKFTITSKHTKLLHACRLALLAYMWC